MTEGARLVARYLADTKLSAVDAAAAHRWATGYVEDVLPAEDLAELERLKGRHDARDRAFLFYLDNGFWAESEAAVAWMRADVDAGVLTWPEVYDVAAHIHADWLISAERRAALGLPEPDGMERGGPAWRATLAMPADTPIPPHTLDTPDVIARGWPNYLTRLSDVTAELGKLSATQGSRADDIASAYRLSNTGLRSSIPGHIADIVAVDRVLDKAEDLTAAARPAAIERLLGKGPGAKPSPEVWFYANVSGEASERDFTGFYLALVDAARQEAETALKAKDAEIEKAERRAKKVRDARLGLGAAVFPGQLMRTGFRTSVFRDLHKEVERARKQGTQTELALNVSEDTRTALARLASVEIAHSELGRLTRSQIRGFLAVYRLFAAHGTSRGDDKQPNGSFNENTIDVSAIEFYQAAGLGSSGGGPRRALFEATREIAAIRMPVVARFELPAEDDTSPRGGRAKGKPGKKEKAPPRYGVLGGKPVEVLGLEPFWTGEDGRRLLSAAELDTIAAAWLERGGNTKREWDLPLPDHYRFTLPPILQLWAGNVSIAGDILERLETGGKSVRGKNAGFEALDFRLLIEITQGLQSGKFDENGWPLGFVNRETMLRDFYRPVRYDATKRRGQVKTRYWPQFEAARQTLEAGGFVRWVREYWPTPQQRGDVFAINPAVVLSAPRRRALAAGAAG